MNRFISLLVKNNKMRNAKQRAQASNDSTILSKNKSNSLRKICTRYSFKRVKARMSEIILLLS